MRRPERGAGEPLGGWAWCCMAGAGAAGYREWEGASTVMEGYGIRCSRPLFFQWVCDSCMHVMHMHVGWVLRAR